MKMITTRWAPFCGTVALLAQALAFQGCGGSNNPATGTGTGGTTATGTGGSTTSSTGGTTATGTGGTTTTSTGGTTATGTGGASGSAGTSGTAFGQPACGNTSTGVAVKKSGACVAADPQLCYNTCGPEKSGAKSETCTNGIYAEGQCAFDPARDFSCFKIAATAPTGCPAATMTEPIVSGSACTGTVQDCTTCSGFYQDSGGTVKQGYCVCQTTSNPNAPTWSCASSNAWPCPSGLGC
jgi:hypothetical protein